MTVIAVYNLKGGVGKTATAVNLAHVAAQQRRRTLVWDLDPQGAATYYFRVKPKVKGGALSLLKKKDRLAAAIRGTDFEYLDLLPADFSFRNLDLVFDQTKKRTTRLSRVVEVLAADYDLVLLDCPPSISLSSENVFAAADVLLVPTIPTTLSVRTLNQLTDFVERSDQPDIPILSFFSMLDGRKNLHAEIIDRLQSERGDVLDTTIPSATEVELMGVHRAPVGTFAPHSVAAKAYQGLWAEIEATLPYL